MKHDSVHGSIKTDFCRLRRLCVWGYAMRGVKRPRKPSPPLKPRVETWGPAPERVCYAGLALLLGDRWKRAEESSSVISE